MWHGQALCQRSTPSRWQRTPTRDRCSVRACRFARRPTLMIEIVGKIPAVGQVWPHRWLESWTGSRAFAAIHGQPVVKACHRFGWMDVGSPPVGIPPRCQARNVNERCLPLCLLACLLRNGTGPRLQSRPLPLSLPSPLPFHSAPAPILTLPSISLSVASRVLGLRANRASEAHLQAELACARLNVLDAQVARLLQQLVA